LTRAAPDPSLAQELAGEGAAPQARQAAALCAAMLQLEEQLCGATGELAKHEAAGGGSSEEDEEMGEEDEVGGGA
jgi:hypothetical protein